MDRTHSYRKRLSKMETIEATVLFQPETDALRFLPEGPYPYRPGELSWVAIQHGAAARAGSINLLNLAGRSNRSVPLPGRPGFAFPSDDESYFVAGIERQLVKVDIRSGECEAISEEVDTEVENTIINDGVAFEHGVVFGCKHLEFSKKIAGLYYWRSADQSIVRLRNDQICSNGKIVHRSDQGWTLLDIDTPTKQVARYAFDPEAGNLGEREVALDLTAESMFPDGMIATPDGQNVIIAFYNPEDADYGVAREYDLEDGSVVAEWRCAGSPQVTCPRLIQDGDDVKLVLTTAVEHMSPERLTRHPGAGSLFIAPTRFRSTPSTPSVTLPS